MILPVNSSCWRLKLVPPSSSWLPGFLIDLFLFCGWNREVRLNGDGQWEALADQSVRNLCLIIATDYTASLHRFLRSYDYIMLNL